MPGTNRDDEHKKPIYNHKTNSSTFAHLQFSFGVVFQFVNESEDSVIMAIKHTNNCQHASDIVKKIGLLVKFSVEEIAD